MNEAELIRACIKNDRKAQNELFRLYKDSLFLISLKYCRNTADAEDNLHDSFLTIFQKIKNFKGNGSFEGWMKRITIYKAIDKYKGGKNSPLEINEGILEGDLNVDTGINLKLDTLLKIIQELPDQYRLVFNLYQMDGYSHKQTSKILNISENTSKSNYHRAKIILRKKIMEAMKTEDFKTEHNEK
ncbi:MAG TPA: RNA polymerase sigma factor [Flavobacteriaceae bacterium]|nr:RNA polymerase sigma factor [Flavobacteriaceae bacterium]